MTDENKPYPLPSSADKFLEHIIDAFPDDFVTLRKIVGVGRVVYSGHPRMTAAVIDTKPYTLFFGRPFMQEWMKTAEDCVYVLAHELTHLILAHFSNDIRELFTEKQLREDATNIILDCQVNATCYHSLGNPKYFEFIKRYYAKDQMPTCFFRYDGVPPTDELKELHKQLYSINGITNKELVEGLMKWFEENQNTLKDHLKNLLGNHENIFKDHSDNSGPGSLSDMTFSYAKDVQKALQDAIDELKDEGKWDDIQKSLDEQAKKKQQKSQEGQKNPSEGTPENTSDDNQGGIAAGHSNTVRSRHIKTVLDKIEFSNKLNSKMERVFVTSPSSRIDQAIEKFFPKKQARSPIPNFYDRRTVALHHSGHMPVFHNRKETGKPLIVPCYVDVSGSQDHVLPYVIPVVSKKKRKIGNVVFCFSTILSPTPINEFSKGKFNTTMGTNFDPIAEHILKNHYKFALILTDGHADMSEHYQKELKKRNVRIKVGWTVPRPGVKPLANLAMETFFVFQNEVTDNAY